MVKRTIGGFVRHVVGALELSSPLDVWGQGLSSERLVYDYNPESRILNDECGIFGIYGPGEDVARQTYFGLYTLQHRGQESAGITVTDGTGFRSHKDMGLVSQVFDEPSLTMLTGFAAIGHTRYSTTGSSRVENAQPVMIESDIGPIAMGHNGNLVNSSDLRIELKQSGFGFSTSTDSELILQLVAVAPGDTLADRVVSVIPKLKGSFSLVFLSRDAIVAARDDLGNRPLCLGSYNGNWIVASESCAFGALKAKFERDLLAGEVLQIDDDGPRTCSTRHHPPTALCVFEYIYFARPDSDIEGSNVNDARNRLGRALAREHGADADVVIGVPDSATAAAIGFARESGIPYAEGLVKSRYIGRTFIQPDDRIRKAGIALKYSTLNSVLGGKRVVVVDDSIVRGNTTKAIVNLIRNSGGASEVHVRISSPPMQWPCFYGIDIQHGEDLIAHNTSVDEICAHIGADSLAYLSVDALVAATKVPANQLCTGCLTMNYPIPVQLEMDKMIFEPHPPDGSAPASNPETAIGDKAAAATEASALIKLG